MNKLMIGPLLGLALGMIAPASSAAVMAGATCQPANPFTGVVYSQYGVQPSNARGEGSSVSCPLVGAFSSATGIVTVVASVYDRHASADVVCDLVLTDQNGSTLYSERRQTTGAALGVNTLTWTNIPARTSYGSLLCFIPGTAGTVAPFAGANSHITTIYLN